MSVDIRQIVRAHHCFYEVSPYHVVTEDRPLVGGVHVRHVQAGFDLDVYGVKPSPLPDPATEYWLAYHSLKELAEAVRQQSDHGTCIDVISFGSTVVLDTRDHLQPMAMLRIRITHTRGLDQPAGPAEQEALKAVEARLENLGLRAGHGRG